ncbi:MAG: TonB-dependent receptor, partial [Acidobacteria bacterium]|nr:TonB-dependent receptor [Acidobacteriota bacterium]
MRRSTLLAFAIVIAVTFHLPAFSQVAATAALLNGTVRDESGSVVVNAAVSVREVDTNRVYNGSSNNAGYYVVPNLPPGRYEMKVSYTGFSPYDATGIVLTVGQTATYDVTLKVQSKGENVVVTGEAPVIEPTRTEISQVIETKQIESLPISGRLFTDFALLTPGVATGRTSLQSTITEFEVTRVSFAGMRDLSNEVTVDGADNINTATGSQRATPPQEAVQEFRVVNNSFGAEYGRALGGIVNIVTKSGTNSFHGSLYEYFQNNSLDARSLLQPSPQPNVLRQNQFGGTLGGPIKKDRTFFFMNYEGQRRGESPTFPSTFLNNLTLINQAKVALGLAPENLNILKTKDNDYGIAKLDQQLSTNNRLSVRYNIEDGRDLNQLVGSTLDGGGIGAPSSGHDVFVRDQSVAGTVTTQLRTNLINSALAQFARRHYNFPGVTGQPNLDIPNSILIGHNFGVLDAIYENREQGSDTLDWVKGSHVMRFGGDVNFVQNFVIWPGFTPMRIVLPGINCLVEFADFANPAANIAPSADPGNTCPLPPFMNGTPIVFWGSPLGTAHQGEPGFPAFPPPLPTTWQYAYRPDQTVNFSETLNHSYYGFFWQDQWRVTPKLTLNYGVRYDFEAGLWKQIDHHYNGVQPRIGFAYAINNKTVVRSGFGLFDDRYNLSFLFITQPQRPAIIPGVNIPGVRVGADRATWALNQLPFGIPGAPSPADVAAALVTTGQFIVPNQITAPTTVGDGLVDHGSKIPYSEQANLEIDREIGRGFAVSVGYMFVAAHHLVRAENLNVCPVSGATTPVGSCPPGGTPPPDWPAGKSYYNNGVLYPAGLLYYTDNSGNSVYHGLTLQANKRAGRWLGFNANYTFSHTLDDGTFTTFVSTPQDLYNRQLERATSNQDVRHRFIANFVIDGPSDTFLRNFQLSGITTIQSPRPFTLFVGFDANGDTNPVTDRVGNAPRNSYQGDSLRSVDLRLSRYFNLNRIREGVRLDLGVDSFNLLNRPNVDEVTSVYGTYNFCSGLVPVRYKDPVSLAIQNFQVGGCPPQGPPIPNPLFGGPRTMLNPR